MIVVLEYVGYANMDFVSSGGILLCEVKSEEDAFAEMCRFLQVNRISSNATYVEMKESREDAGRVIPRHKRVGMYMHGCLPYNRNENKYAKDVTFGIYYGSDRPKCERLVDPEDLGSCDEKKAEWYNCIKRYLDDLSARKAGGG